VGSSENNVGGSSEKVGSSENNVGGSPEKVGSSENNVGGSPEKVGSSENNVGGTQRGWMIRKQLEQQICKYCQDYCSIEEIALSINRNIDYLKNKILPKMIQDGLLERQYPDTPSHPMQKYKASDPE
ncbi:MAG: AAA family ATPase, partial [Alistipes sp.]